MLANSRAAIGRITIVAVAPKLLIALWRYLETGLVPEGAGSEGRTVTVDELVGVGHSGLKAALLAVAVMDDRRTVSNVLVARWLRRINEVSIGYLFLQHEGVNSAGA